MFPTKLIPFKVAIATAGARSNPPQLRSGCGENLGEVLAMIAVETSAGQIKGFIQPFQNSFMANTTEQNSGMLY
jgi:hypothetical protein